MAFYYSEVVRILKKKKKIIVGSILAVAVIAGAVTGVIVRENKKPQVKIESVSTGSIESTYTTSGKVKSEKQKNYTMTTPIKVLTVKVKEGDKVKKGDLLATFDTDALETTIKGLKSQYYNAKKAYTQAANNASKNQKDLDSINSQIAALEKKIAGETGASQSGDSTLKDFLNNTSAQTDEMQLTMLKSQKTVIEAQKNIYNLDQMKSTASTAEKALDDAQTQIDTLKDGWHADFDGFISSVDITAGEVTPVLQPGIVLENADDLVIDFNIGKYDVQKIKVGQQAKVTTENGALDGTVSFISPVATNSSSALVDTVGELTGLSSLTTSSPTLKAQVKISNPNNSVIIGLDADISIKTGGANSATVIPIEALKSDTDGSNYCFVYNSDKRSVEKRHLKLGLASDKYYQVTSGLKVGEKIVTNPMTTLENGTKVRLLKRG